MPKIKLQVGEVQAEEMIPSFDAIASEIDSNGIFGYVGDRHGVAVESDEDEYSIGEDYIYMRYVQEVTEERKQIEDGEVTIGDGNIARIMRFLLTRDGEYAYESTSGVYDNHALEYLIGEDSFEIDFTCDRYNRFTRDQMREFYQRAFRVRGFKIDEIGDRDGESVSVSSEVQDYVEDAGESAVRAVFSTGTQDNSLESPDMIDGFARLSSLNYIRMKDSEGQINEAHQNGRYTIRYPADLDLDQQGEIVRGVLESVTDGLTTEEDD